MRNDQKTYTPTGLTPEQAVRWAKVTDQNVHTARQFRTLTGQELTTLVVGNQSKEKTRYRRFDARTANLNSLKIALERGTIDGEIIGSRYVLSLRNKYAVACMPTEFETLMVSAILHEVSIDEDTLTIDLLRPKQP